MSMTAADWLHVAIANHREAARRLEHAKADMARAEVRLRDAQLEAYAENTPGVSIVRDPLATALKQGGL